MGVLTPLGETALTRMESPLRTHSKAAALENIMTAALLAREPDKRTIIQVECPQYCDPLA